jgi:hypothetical protein
MIPIPLQDVSNILRMGTPKRVLTYQGTNFLGNLFKNTYKLLKIKKLQTTEFRLQRSQRVLAEYLRHYVNKDRTNWDEWVHYATYVYNTTVHTSTGYTPFELVYGFQSTLPSTFHEAPSPQYNYDYIMELKSRLQVAHVANQKLTVKQNSKEYFDTKSEEFHLSIGDKVLL